MNFSVEAFSKDLRTIRDTSPLVHNITNFVVMNNTANALLAIGASPVMSHAREEVEEMVALASSLVINIGTLNGQWIEAMDLAMAAAANKGIPIVFDPVGAGATAYRTRTCLDLLNRTAPKVIRGNASEIMVLAGSAGRTKGVDSSAATHDAESAARILAEKYGCVVVVSGATDLITDGQNDCLVHNGHPLMTRVTGLGCTATALIGAYCAIDLNPLAAAGYAMMTMGICGEIAAAQAAGPGTLQLHFLDALYALSPQQLERHWQHPHPR